MKKLLIVKLRWQILCCSLITTNLFHNRSPLNADDKRDMMAQLENTHNGHLGKPSRGRESTMERGHNDSRWPEGSGGSRNIAPRWTLLDKTGQDDTRERAKEGNKWELAMRTRSATT